MGCLVCGEPTTGRRKTCSAECLGEVRAAHCYRMNTTRARARKNERTCPQCHETKPLIIKHFTPSKRNDAGEIIRWAGWCRPCAAEKARQRRLTRTPEQIEADRAYHHAVYETRKNDAELRARRNAARRRWVQQNPEKHRAATRRWYEQMKADPEKHARYLQTTRIAYRLRQERLGRTVSTNFASALGAWRNTRKLMPVEPFALWLDEVLASDARDLEQLAGLIDIPERRIYDYRERISEHVAFASAERALTRYGPVRIHPKHVERSLERMLPQLEAYWRNAPGNGNRLTGYLAATEPIVALAGAVIVTTEDLWPA